MREQIKSIGLLTTLMLILFCYPELAQEWHDNHLMLTPDELEWEPVASMGEGASIVLIEGDLSEDDPRN